MFALAFLHEGYPLAVMEALAAGLPVVATDAGGVPEAIRDGVEGFVVPSAAGTAGRRDLAPPRRRRPPGADGRRRNGAGQAFDIAGPVARTEEIYRSAIARQ